jgi:hypothetical protein
MEIKTAGRRSTLVQVAVITGKITLSKALLPA